MDKGPKVSPYGRLSEREMLSLASVVEVQQANGLIAVDFSDLAGNS